MAVKISVALFLAVACQAQSLKTVVVAGTAGTFTSSGSARATYRLEFRINNIEASKTYVNNNAGSGNLINCITNTTHLTCTIASEGAPSGTAELAFTVGEDVRVRFNHEFTTGSSGITTFQLWLGDCSGYTSSIKAISSIQSVIMASAPWSIGPNISGMAFLRMYSTVDTSAACPVDAPTISADLFDFTFEDGSGGTLVARAGGYTMSAAGSSFVDSTTYPPSAAITGWTSYLPSFRAMTGQAFSGATSVSFTYPGTGAPSDYFWTQLSGPAQSTFSSRTSATPTITPPLAGQYVYQLTVTDGAGATGAITQTIGVVAADTNNVTILPSSDLTWALGNTVKSGSGPWPWLDVTEAADVDLLNSLMSTAPTYVAGPGTCTIPSGSPNQLSGGFITALTYGGVAIDCTGSDFAVGDVGSRIVILWDADGDGGFDGRYVTYVNQYVSATRVVSNSFAIREPAASFSSGLSWGRVNLNYLPYYLSDGSSQILNFYEAGLAVGREWARTGLATYKTQWHAFCNNTWYWSTDAGYSPMEGRNSVMQLLIACGSDPTYTAPPNLWAGIARLTENLTALYGGTNPTSPVSPMTTDPREASYGLRATASLAKIGGNHGLTTATWCTRLANQITNIWIAGASQPSGFPANTYSFYAENLFLSNISIPSAPIGGVFGTSPWRSNGLPLIAITMAYEALADTSTCNNPSLAAQLLTLGGAGTGLIPQIANYIYSFGRGPDGGVFGATGYKNDTDGEDPKFLFYNGDPTGACQAQVFVVNCRFYEQRVSVTNGSTAVTGFNTVFTKHFWNGGTINLGGTLATIATVVSDTSITLSAPFSGSTLSVSPNYQNISTISVINGSSTVTGVDTLFTTQFPATYPIICIWDPISNDRSCYGTTVVTDTNLTLDRNYTGTTRSGIGTFVINRAAVTNCGPLTISPTCSPDRYGGRNVAADVVASAAWLYRLTGDTSWRDKADYYINKLFGGSSSGAGAVASPPTGTAIYAPGTITCTNASTACTGVGTAFQTQFSPCNGTTSITIASGQSGSTWDTYARAGNPSLQPTFITQTVAACPSDTSLTLSVVFSGSTSTATGMFYNGASSAWAGADGGVGNLGEILPTCGSAPCGINSLVPKYGKPLGMASGSGNVPVALADRLGGLAPVSNRTLLVSGNISAVPNATKMRVTITLPSGTVTATTCTSSPCSVTGDVRQSGALMQIAYLSSGDAVLANGDAVPIAVQ